MKLSERWLREWINPDIDSATLTNQITMAGLEVETVEPVFCQFSNGVVIGQVLECVPHPNSDQLRIVKVDIGEERLLNIVCGAPNCRTHLRVAVATIGTFLPGNLKVKMTEVLHEPSEGMLCSFSELGIFEGNSDIIIEFPEDAQIGQDLRDYLQFDDNIIDISVTPNRADCLSLLGISRDVAVLNRLPLPKPNIDPVIPVINDTLQIRVDVPKYCPRYLGRVIKNINISITTPLWMKEKLRRCGIRSMNAVVDITNYVVLELGQPIHAFDLNHINGYMHVRLACQDEVFTFLDRREETLTSDTLVISDQEKVLAMAGIVEGIQACINQETRNIVVGCAFFHPIAISGRARYYGLHTDFSHRYERGVDPTLQQQAMEYVTALLVTICGGRPGPVTSVTTKTALPPLNTITLRRSKLDHLIGHMITDHEVNDILSRLGCHVTRINEGWEILSPHWRFDIKMEEDIIEEIVRIYGYDMIPNIPLHTKIEMHVHRESTLPLSRVKTLLVDLGYQETITYSFVDPKIQNLLHPKQASLLLPRPISIEMSAMRLSLWTGLIGAVIYNQNRQQKRIRFFESGLRFIPDDTVDLGIRQDFMLSGVMTGPRCDEHWDLTHQTADFYDVKGDIEAIFELTGKLDDVKFHAQPNPALHPGQSAAIYLHEECIGFIGMIHPALEATLKLNGRTLVFEFLWEKISECKVPKATDIPHFPFYRRDISIVVNETTSASDVLAECKKNIKNQLIDIVLFDVYRDERIMKGYKSLAIRLILQDPTRTLKEEEISETVKKCVVALTQRFQASLRN